MNIKLNLISILCRVFNRAIRLLYKVFPDGLASHGRVVDPQNISLSNGMFLKFARIDVGLSDDASHSVEFLMENQERLIVGIEPHPENIQKIIKGAPKFHSISLADGYIRKGYLVKRIEELDKKFILVGGAAGSVDIPTTRKFYSAYPDRGNSSLYNFHSKKFSGNEVDKVIEVIEFPLSIILGQLKTLGFNFIESLKIDTEGHELDVLKGAGDYLNMVLYCRVECFVGSFEGSKNAQLESFPSHIILHEDGYSDSASAVIHYLEKFNFKLIASHPGDYVFLNQNLEYLLTQHELYP